MTLSKKHSAFVDEYLRCFNGTNAYLRVYPHCSHKSAWANASRLLSSDSVSEAIKQRLVESHMSADEALQILADQGRANLANYFKVGEEWVRWPLPTQEILGEKEVKETDVDGKVIDTYPMYWVRRIYLDLDKLTDPNYARLVDEFSDSPKNGLSIKLAKKSDIADKILRVFGRYKNNLDITSAGERIGNTENAERYDRAISTLADALRETLSGKGAEQNSEVDSAEQTTMASPVEPGG